MSKMSMKKLISIACFSLTTFATYAYSFNMSYVEVNSNRLANVACYVRSDNRQPFFNATAIFAGNINGKSPNQPEIFYNENVAAVLQSSQIAELHGKGIKVLMTLLGNHQNAGWSCMTDESAAQKFAGQIVAMVKKYNLDGVDIDDEYSNCVTNPYSLIMLAQAIKNQRGFEGKLLTKALFADGQYFAAIYKGHHLAEYLDDGWEMTYSVSDFNARLSIYLQNGMTTDKLMIGGWATYPYPDPYLIGQYQIQKSLAGTMVYDIGKHTQSYLNQLLRGQTNKQVSIEVLPDCLA